MPLTSSAKKALATDKRRKIENDLTRAKVKSALKGAKIAIRENQKETPESISKAFSELDRAAKKNVIHKNKAARLKSRLVKRLAKAGDAAAAKPVAKKKATAKSKKK